MSATLPFNRTKRTAELRDRLRDFLWSSVTPAVGPYCHDLRTAPEEVHLDAIAKLQPAGC